MDAKIVLGDNYAIMRTMPDSLFKLIYIDPPFNSDRVYSDTEGEFNDKFQSTQDYLDYMLPRLREMKRVLQTGGTLVCHCDWHADAHLRLLIERVGLTFIGPVYWVKATCKFASKYFDPVCDTLLIFSKGEQTTWHPQFRAYTSKDLGRFNKIDDTGPYRWQTLKAGGTQVTKNRRVFTYRGCTGMWVNSEETMEEAYQKGDLLIKDDQIFKKQRPIEGVKLTNLWDDIPPTGGQEHLGYPTQKPVQLLQRVIAAYTNKGDWVADFFCGSGTTAVAAKSLERNYYCTDIS